jgi:hypothetical protein
LPSLREFEQLARQAMGSDAALLEQSPAPEAAQTAVESEPAPQPSREGNSSA